MAAAVPFQVRAEDRVAADDLDADLYSEDEGAVEAEAGRLASKRAAAAVKLEAKLKAEPGGELVEPGQGTELGSKVGSGEGVRSGQGGARKRGGRGGATADAPAAQPKRGRKGG